MYLNKNAEVIVRDMKLNFLTASYHKFIYNCNWRFIIAEFWVLVRIGLELILILGSKSTLMRIERKNQLFYLNTKKSTVFSVTVQNLAFNIIFL